MSEITTKTWTPTEIRGIADDGWFLALPGTIAAGNNVAKGTVLGKITASGKLAPYDDAVSPANGLETAVGIAVEAVDATDNDKPCAVYVTGIFVESLLTGLDANAKTDLGGRTILQGLFKF